MVLEQHSRFGGCLQTFKRDNYTFDTGLHYFGSMAQGEVLYKYWKYAGLTDHLALIQMDPDKFDIISFPDAEYPLAQGFENFRAQLIPYFPKEERALKCYTEKLQEIAAFHPLYHLEVPSNKAKGHFHNMKALDFLNALSPIPVKGMIGNRVLADVLAGNNFLCGGTPDSISLHQFGLINHSYISSAWRPAGGSQQIADLLVKNIDANGGSVKACKKVIKIEKKGNIFCINSADGDQFQASQVISDIHPVSTLSLLKGIPVSKAYRERIQSLRNTTSVFMLFLGLKPEAFPYMNHNIYHHNTPDVWSSGASGAASWPGHFLFMTPPEKNQDLYASTAIVMTTMRFDEVSKWKDTSCGNRGGDYDKFKSIRTEKLLTQVYGKFPQLKKAIQCIYAATPLTWRDYTGTPEGSMYGIRKEVDDPVKTLILPKTKVPGLFLTGQSVNLHGALGVTIGAVMTCAELLGMKHLIHKIRNGI